MFAFDRQRFLAEFTARTGVAMNPARQHALTFLLDSIERDDGFTTLRELAYVLATIHWETGRTFSPVKELRANEARNPSLYARQQRYWPSGYYGRGYVQLTWDYNYKNASRKLEGEAFPVAGALVTVTPTTFLEHPDYLLEPSISYRIAARGMREGWFTGKRLSQYIPAASAPDYVNARRIINGVDRAAEIAEIAKKYEALLSATLAGGVADASVTVPPSMGERGGAAAVAVDRRVPSPRPPISRAQSVGRSSPPPAESRESPVAVTSPAGGKSNPAAGGKPASKTAAKNTGKKVAKRTAKKAVKKTAKNAPKTTAKKVVRKAVKKLAKKVVTKVAKNAAKTAAKKAARKGATKPRRRLASKKASPRRVLRRKR